MVKKLSVLLLTLVFVFPMFTRALDKGPTTFVNPNIDSKGSAESIAEGIARMLEIPPDRRPIFVKEYAPQISKLFDQAKGKIDKVKIGFRVWGGRVLMVLFVVGVGLELYDAYAVDFNKYGVVEPDFSDYLITAGGRIVNLLAFDAPKVGRLVYGVPYYLFGIYNDNKLKALQPQLDRYEKQWVDINKNLDNLIRRGCIQSNPDTGEAELGPLADPKTGSCKLQSQPNKSGPVTMTAKPPNTVINNVLDYYNKQQQEKKRLGLSLEKLRKMYDQRFSELMEGGQEISPPIPIVRDSLVDLYVKKFGTARSGEDTHQVKVPSVTEGFLDLNRMRKINKLQNEVAQRQKQNSERLKRLEKIRSREEEIQRQLNERVF